MLFLSHQRCFASVTNLYFKVPGYADMRAVWGHAVDLAYYYLQAGHHVLHGTEVSAHGACMHASTGRPQDGLTLKGGHKLMG